MSHDLLRDPASTVYAAHCTPENGVLFCGALYVTPNNPFTLIRLADNGATFDVELPPELVGSEQFVATWNISLPLVASSHG
jgi:hypothetical protein